jgi:glucose-1-phosphate cytidylyltransferase
MQVIILCGGRGTRLREQTEFIPKPLVEIGGLPILWHVMKIYAHFGFTDFILALGYLGHRIKDYFLPYGGEQHGVRLPIADCQSPDSGKSPIANRQSPIGAEWHILFADTGQDTPTGGRIKALEQFIEGDTFLATYSDGLADLDLSALLAFHRSHGRLATLTAVRPYSQFGLLDLEETGRIARFREKPRLEDWVNGGFFVFERGVFDYLQPDSTLEREPFERLAADGEIFAYRHEGFWDCMDTYKDTEVLNQLWNTGQAPWRV